jgi:hypothetical protein
VAARVYLVPVSPKGVTIDDSGSGRRAMRKLEYVGCREARVFAINQVNRQQLRKFVSEYAFYVWRSFFMRLQVEIEHPFEKKDKLSSSKNENLGHHI